MRKLVVSSCLLGLALSAASASAVSVVQPPSQVTYNFSGFCVDCTSPSGKLVLQGYKPGTEFTFDSEDSSTDTNTFVSFQYSSSIFNASGKPGTVAPINVSVSGTDDIYVDGSVGGSFDIFEPLAFPKDIFFLNFDYFNLIDRTTGYSFRYSAFPIGQFCAGDGSGAGAAGDSCGYSPISSADYGFGGSLSATPEPGGLALMGTGLAFAGAVRRRYFR